MTISFTPDQKQAISAAIQAAEKRTSGEFVAVVARRADPYHSISLLWAAGLSLLVPGILLLSALPLRFVEIYQLQLAAFILLVLLFSFVPALHLALVPKSVKHARA